MPSSRAASDQIYRRERPDVVLHYTIKPNIYGTLGGASWRACPASTT
ncbi:MAG: hypothetical protein WKG07_25335 [Hymenobacter sp.]